MGYITKQPGTEGVLMGVEIGARPTQAERSKIEANKMYIGLANALANAPDDITRRSLWSQMVGAMRPYTYYDDQGNPVIGNENTNVGMSSPGYIYDVNMERMKKAAEKTNFPWVWDPKQRKYYIPNIEYKDITSPSRALHKYYYIKNKWDEALSTGATLPRQLQIEAYDWGVYPQNAYLNNPSFYPMLLQYYYGTRPYGSE